MSLTLRVRSDQGPCQSGPQIYGFVGTISQKKNKMVKSPCYKTSSFLEQISGAHKSSALKDLILFGTNTERDLVHSVEKRQKLF